ncbi:MAG TPA: hypothetical protein VN258_06140 [Mobilitalea sp.]|nr:hypothetical protein [Mobilitalea sp.]
MNIEKLKAQEERFFINYPGGFQDPKMEPVSKRHNIARFVKLVEENLSEASFHDPEKVLATISKILTGSFQVSVFEKTAFKRMLNEMNPIDKTELAEAFHQLLHGNQALGFEQVTNILDKYKNAKWPLVTAVLYYSNPSYELVIKPTTVKQVIEYFELVGLKYVSKPNYEFYTKYRERINELKSYVSPELHVENGAFCGFLMFAIGLYE